MRWRWPASLFALNRYGAFMDYYEKAILVLAAAPTFAVAGLALEAGALADGAAGGAVAVGHSTVRRLTGNGQHRNFS